MTEKFEGSDEDLYALSHQMAPEEEDEFASERLLRLRELDREGFCLIVDELFPEHVVLPDKRIFSHDELEYIMNRNKKPPFGNRNFMELCYAWEYLLAVRDFYHLEKPQI